MIPEFCRFSHHVTLVISGHSPRVIEGMAEGMVEGPTKAVIEGAADAVIATPMMKSRSAMGRSSTVVAGTIGTSTVDEENSICWLRKADSF